jgi:ubiquinone/menaquinone biosynthesis C-methylase UbiE
LLLICSIKTLCCDEYVLKTGTKQFYETGIEKNRLFEKWGRFEKVRVEQILNKFLPQSPAIIADVGGGTGVYSFGLSKKGYIVHLIDPVSINIEEAKKNEKDFPLRSYIVADARKIPLANNSVDVVLFFGPLYHLDEKNRQIALSEAYRILKPNGFLFAQGVSKFCLLFNHYSDGKAKNPESMKMVDHCLDNNEFEYKGGFFFTHTPEKLKEELKKAGFKDIKLLAVEGLGKWQDLEYWENENLRKDLLFFIEKTQSEPSILGTSAHIMAIGQKK